MTDGGFMSLEHFGILICEYGSFLGDIKLNSHRSAHPWKSSVTCGTWMCFGSASRTSPEATPPPKLRRKPSPLFLVTFLIISTLMIACKRHLSTGNACFYAIVLLAEWSAVGVIMSSQSVCLSVYLWRCALWLNDTSHSKSVRTSE